MTKIPLIAAALTAGLLAGCQSTEQIIDKEQQTAIDTALQHARFEMNCPAATGTVLSRKEIEPVSVRFGVVRNEYTVGIEGCNQRTTMAVLCTPADGGCVAGGEEK